jgi:hypothetical protein
VSKGHYDTRPEQFHKDILLMWENTRVFNEDDSDAYRAADTMEEFTGKLMSRYPVGRKHSSAILKRVLSGTGTHLHSAALFLRSFNPILYRLHIDEDDNDSETDNDNDDDKQPAAVSTVSTESGVALFQSLFTALSLLLAFASGVHVDDLKRLSTMENDDKVNKKQNMKVGMMYTGAYEAALRVINHVLGFVMVGPTGKGKSRAINRLAAPAAMVGAANASEDNSFPLPVKASWTHGTPIPSTLCYIDDIDEAKVEFYYHEIKSGDGSSSSSSTGNGHSRDKHVERKSVRIWPLPAGMRVPASVLAGEAKHKFTKNMDGLTAEQKRHVERLADIRRVLLDPLAYLQLVNASVATELKSQLKSENDTIPGEIVISYPFGFGKQYRVTDVC